MRLPVRSVTFPEAIVGKANGRLPASALTRLPGDPDILLAKPAALSFQAMRAAAADSGHRLWTSSLTNSYRPYATQEAIFLARYYPSMLGTTWWNGRRWRKKSGVAAAAVPGTSNHGWGLALDFENLTDAATRWLIDHAHTYGFSGEIQSEPWHWRYFAGDDLTAAVVEYHRPTPPPPPPGDHTGGLPMLIQYGFFVWLNEGWRYRQLSSPGSVASFRAGGGFVWDLSHEPATLRALLNEAKTAGRLVQGIDADKLLDQLNG